MWGLDIGTTNTSLARWEEKSDRPHLVQLPGLIRPSEQIDGGSPPQIVPSAVQLLEAPSVWTRVGTWGPLSRRQLWGQLAHIGQRAIEHSDPARPRGFVPTFKAALGREPLRPLTQLRGKSYSA